MKRDRPKTVQEKWGVMEEHVQEGNGTANYGNKISSKWKPGILRAYHLNFLLCEA